MGPDNVDPRFEIVRVSYDAPIGLLISSSDPTYASPLPLFRARSNSLGFAFNAALVKQQIERWVAKFKNGKNPVQVPLAAVQVDVVAHSMGGDIARTMASRTDYLGNSTYGQGTIHKLVTVDTPHLGSQLAGLLLQPNEEGGCVESEFALFAGNFAFKTVSLGSNPPISGAIADLTPLSSALQTIAKNTQHPIPTALIAGVYTNYGGLSPNNSFVGSTCSLVGDPLAVDLTPTGWPAIFNPQANDPNGGNNDAIVSETSQLAGLAASSSGGVFVFPGFLHSPSLPGGFFEGLGFSGMSVLDPGPSNPIPNGVIKLLNIPVTDRAFTLLNP